MLRLLLQRQLHCKPCSSQPAQIIAGECIDVDRELAALRSSTKAATKLCTGTHFRCYMPAPCHACAGSETGGTPTDPSAL